MLVYDGPMKEERISYEIAKLNKKYLDLYHTIGIYEERKNFKTIAKTFRKYVVGGRFKELAHLAISFLNRKKKLVHKDYDEVFTSDYDDDLKVAIYTCIVGAYDSVKEPVYHSKNCDYFLVTDGEVSKDSIWKKIDLGSIENTLPLNSREKARYIKTHPHELFPNYAYSVWVDGSFTIMADVMPLIGGMHNSWFGVHTISSGMDCVYENALCEIGEKKAPKKDIERQVQTYKSEGYPKHNGLYETGILIRRHNDELCIKVDEDWWGEMKKFCMRDQMSINYVMWKNSISDTDICILGNNIYLNPRFMWQPHRNS